MTILPFQKLKNKAFLVAKVTGWEKLSLIEGSVDVFYQNKFVGESTISPQFANDTLDISLGRSTRILVNRIKINDKNNRSIFSNDIIETVTYRTTIRNTSNTSVKIQVEDQLPISQDPEIEVKSIEISGGKLDGNSGILTWRYDLAALEAKEILVSFSVKYPKNKAGLFNSEIQRKRSRSKF